MQTLQRTQHEDEDNYQDARGEILLTSSGNIEGVLEKLKDESQELKHGIKRLQNENEHLEQKLIDTQVNIKNLS
jgi:predicted RNase H-like nuclease (RuvC/YqgF family)